MNTQRNLTVTETGHPISYETSRQRASQARSEFLSQAFAALYQSIRKAMEKGLGAVAHGTDRPLKDA